MAVEHFSHMWRVAPCSGASLLALLSLADNAGGSGILTIFGPMPRFPRLPTPRA